MAILFWYKAILALPTAVLQKQKTRSNGYSYSIELHSAYAYPLSIWSGFSPLPHPLFHIGDWPCGETVSKRTLFPNLREELWPWFFSVTALPHSSLLAPQGISQPAPGDQSVVAESNSSVSRCSGAGSLCFRKLQLCFGGSISNWKFFSLEPCKP